MTDVAPAPRVVLVETEPNLPGLLPFPAWDVLGTADEVLLRDPDAHPSAVHLHLAGLDLVRLEPATLAPGDLDLTRPGDPTDRRLAKALVHRALTRGSAVYLLGPDDGRLPPVVGGEAQADGVEVELVFLAQQPSGVEVLRLIDVMRQLRHPDHGCPWDLQQDHASLVRYLVEETYEVIDAIEHGADHDLAEELGDLLLQVVFHAQVGMDRRAFTIDDVARGIADKLVRRHPHVFADGEASTPAEVQEHWDRLKAQEKGRAGPFEGVPTLMPGLELLTALQRKAAKLGFDWRDASEPLERISLELAELRTALAEQHEPEVVAAELGDLLGAVVGLARHLDVDADRVARDAGRKFRSRFEAVLRAAAARDQDVAALDRDDWLSLWDEAKSTEQRPGDR